MPLSEHEQKLLEQMERALYAEDPKFASQMKGRRAASGPPRKRLLIGLCVAIVGLACVVAGVGLSQIWLGGVGFAVMVAGVAWAFAGSSEEGAPSRPRQGRRTPGAGRGKAKRTGSGSFMQRMENRWDERKRGESA